MATAADGEIKVRNGKAPRVVENERGNGLLVSAGRAEGSAPEVANDPWRFVLAVGPVPGGPTVPFVLERVVSFVLRPDATVLEEPFGLPLRIRFDRSAPTRAEAIDAAIREVESVGLCVLRVANDDLVTTADVAHGAGRSQETVRL